MGNVFGTPVERIAISPESKGVSVSGGGDTGDILLHEVDSD